MKHRLFSVMLTFFIVISIFSFSSYALAITSEPMATFTVNLPTSDDSLYMGSGDSWPLHAQIQFAYVADVGTVTYQWYRAVGDGAFAPYGDPVTVDTINSPVFSTENFERPTTEGGIFTYYVVFSNTKDSVTTTFESNHRTTYIAPQVLSAKDQNYDYTQVYYYFQGSPAAELTVNLGLPDDTPEFAETSYGTIKYQWYKSTEAVSEFVYDDFPFFDEATTPAMTGASGTISYADAADADGATVSYTPLNDEVGHFNYFVFVYDELNGVISYTPDAMDAVIEVLPAPVTSINRYRTSATVNLAVTLPTGRTVDTEFGYLLVNAGVDPGADPAYNTGTLDNAAATLNLYGLGQGRYDLYLVFTDDESTEWNYVASIPSYHERDNHDNNADNIDAHTGDGTIQAEGTMTKTSSGVTVTITGDSFADMASHSQNTGSGIQINTDEAVITFDAAAVDHINDLADEGSVVLKIHEADTSVLSDENQALIGDHPVYDFTLTADGKQVSSFGGGTATISIPYKLGANELPEAVVVYYIDDKGNLVTVKGAYNANTKSVEFTVEHFSYYAFGYNLVAFADVTQGDWYYEAVTFIAARDITTGTGNNLFAPNSPVTRGQFITMLLRAYDIDPDTAPLNNFSDAGNTYYTGYLAAAKQLGIANGIGGNQFAPENEISRQDMFTLLYRALDTLGELPDTKANVALSVYADGGAIANYARDAFEWLIASGIVKGNGGYLFPTHTASRAEMAMVFYGLLSE